jgi:lysozyme family protein
MTDAQIIAYCVQTFEGEGFTDDPLDPGGATKWGITHRTYADVLGREPTRTEMEAMTFDHACTMHRELAILRPGFSAIRDWRLKLVVVDVAINFGPLQATKWLQHALRVKVDGIIGPETRHALILPLHPDTATRVIALRQRRHLERVRERPDQIRFLAGWLSRCTSLLEQITQ